MVLVICGINRSITAVPLPRTCMEHSPVTHIDAHMRDITAAFIGSFKKYQAARLHLVIRNVHDRVILSLRRPRERHADRLVNPPCKGGTVNPVFPIAAVQIRQPMYSRIHACMEA